MHVCVCSVQGSRKVNARGERTGLYRRSSFGKHQGTWFSRWHQNIFLTLPIDCILVIGDRERMGPNILPPPASGSTRIYGFMAAAAIQFLVILIKWSSPGWCGWGGGGVILDWSKCGAGGGGYTMANDHLVQTQVKYLIQSGISSKEIWRLTSHRVIVLPPLPSHHNELPRLSRFAGHSSTNWVLSSRAIPRDLFEIFNWSLSDLSPYVRWSKNGFFTTQPA